MKVVCIYWKGDYFKEGTIYTLDNFECVYNPVSNYTSAEPWFMYNDNRSCFILATPLIEALA
jgi:hypothetical protein